MKCPGKPKVTCVLRSQKNDWPAYLLLLIPRMSWKACICWKRKHEVNANIIISKSSRLLLRFIFCLNFVFSYSFPISLKAPSRVGLVTFSVPRPPLAGWGSPWTPSQNNDFKMHTINLKDKQGSGY